LLILVIGGVAAMQIPVVGKGGDPNNPTRYLSGADMTETALCSVPTDQPGGYVMIWEIFGTPTPTPEKRAQSDLISAMTKIALQPGKGPVGTPVTLQSPTPPPDVPVSALVDGDPERGKIIFYTVGACASCHDATNGTTIVARPLNKIGTEAKTRNRELSAAAYIRSVLYNPDENVRPPTERRGIMPRNYLTMLTAQQVNDLIAFLLTLK
jgi:mono/diheme cytochrome c family protein